MCGIAGVLYRDETRWVDPMILKRMSDSIAHRGPDAEGFWSSPGIGLAHRRLSIIDIAGSQQPLSNEDGSVHVVFNGELYNYRALRPLLEQHGHTLQTDGDTETLVHLYEDRGDRLVDLLRGMFAFALWDSTSRRLLLARDRIGIKPLYVYRDAEKLLFGSELKAILAHPDVDRGLDVRALEEYLAYGMVGGTRSIFSRIEKLAPAHLLSVTPDTLGATPRRYWSLGAQTHVARSTADWLDAVRDKIDESVKLHLIADVPVGAFLSGGLDSSVMVARAVQHAGGAVQTFSIGFQEEAFSELPFARLIARRFGTEHHEAIVTPDAVQLIDRFVHHYDEPFADSSAVPTFLVSHLASQHVKVVLSGDGGDEAFGGYPRYAHDAWESAIRDRVPVWLRRGLLRRLAAMWPNTQWLPRPLRAKTLLTNLSLDADAAYANSLAICRLPLRRRLLQSDLVRDLNRHDPGRLIREAYAAGAPGDPVAAMIAADVRVRLPDDYLVKIDRASMAHGLEVRPPLLDHELLELAMTIPSELKVKGRLTKWILKEAYRDFLPPVVVERRKQGFEIPIDRWLSGPLRNMFESAVLASSAPVAGYLNQDVARRAYQQHLSGISSRQGNMLWSLLVLARWVDRYRPEV